MTRIRRRQAGFTLVEMLTVVAIMAAVAGLVVVLVTGLGQQTDQQLIQAECAELRQAVLRFRSDMGEPPRFIAELLQSPDPASPFGGWWWRADGTPAATLRAYDPATRRGWSGPYVHSDCLSSGDQETVEARLVGAATYEKATAMPSAGRRLTMLWSRYSTYPQKQDGTQSLSHYQMDFSDPGEVAVRFVADPLATPAEARVVVRLGTGLQP